MKSAATTSIRAVQTGALRPVAPMARTFASSACSRDASAEAESSTSSGKSTIIPGETIEQHWTREMNNVRDWRRRYAATKANVPLYIPEPASKPKGTATPTEASLSTLLAAGAALGHSSQLLTPAFSPYVYGTRSGLSIIDLEQTLPLLRRAATLVRDVVKADGVVVFVGTRKMHKKIVVAAAERLGDNGYATDDWMPGMLTNADTYFGLNVVKRGAYVPDLVVFLNPSENVGGIRECTARNVPTIGLIDSNTDPRLTTYAIPANMESLRTVELVAGTLSIAGQEGRRMRLRDAEKALDRRNRDSEWRRRAGAQQ